MKKKGCHSDYKYQRDRELFNAYKAEVEQSEFIVLDKIWQNLARAPCSRFWVSEERAAIVVGSMFRGDRLTYMRSPKKTMFREIFKRVKALKKIYPDRSVYRLCIMVVNSPAPSFYMTPLSIRQTVYTIKQQMSKKEIRK